MANRTKNADSSLIQQKKKQVYQELKRWDTKRGQILGYHLKLVIHILNHLDAKIKFSKQYLNYVENMISSRISKIESYLQAGLTKSDFVLSGTLIKSYEKHRNILKQMSLIEGRRQEQYQHKRIRLTQIFKDFRDIKESSAENQDQSPEASLSGSYSSSLIILKYNVREVIECDMPDIIKEVGKKCKKVSDIYNSELKEDLYQAISQLVDGANQQYKMHKRIAKELMNLINQFIERERNCNIKLKNTLLQCLEEEKLLTQQISEQLLKTNDNPLIQDYYNIEDMTTDFHQLSPIKYNDTKTFISQFTIQSFLSHEALILCDYNGIYNQKVEVQIIITLDYFVILRKPGHLKPDFSFLLQKGVEFKKNGDLSLIVCFKKRKGIFLRFQKQFEFTLQFNNQEDLNHFQSTTLRISQCIFV